MLVLQLTVALHCPQNMALVILLTFYQGQKQMTVSDAHAKSEIQKQFRTICIMGHQEIYGQTVKGASAVYSAYTDGNLLGTSSNALNSLRPRQRQLRFGMKAFVVLSTKIWTRKEKQCKCKD